MIFVLIARIALSRIKSYKYSEIETVSEAVHITVGIYLNAGDGISRRADESPVQTQTAIIA